ncbi:MAG: hypothetical protein R2881_10590 [Eubacteriales bacterium]
MFRGEAEKKPIYEEMISLLAAQQPLHKGDSHTPGEEDDTAYAEYAANLHTEDLLQSFIRLRMRKPSYTARSCLQLPPDAAEHLLPR